MKLYILGNGKPLLRIVHILRNHKIQVLGVEQDKPLKGDDQISLERELYDLKIKRSNYKSISDDIDLIFVINYNKIIDVSLYNKPLINLHLGILPKYRGNNANAWAAINGEKKVGYTIHEIIDELDGGDIYYTFKYDISDDDNYLPAKTAIYSDIESKIATILLDIYNKKLVPMSQKGSHFIYCTRLRPSFGIIKDWNFSTEFFMNMMYVYSPPSGTGLKFFYKGLEYRIEKASRVANFENSIGIPGAIVYIRKGSLWVKTKDNVLSIDKLTSNGSDVEIESVFKIGGLL